MSSIAGRSIETLNAICIITGVTDDHHIPCFLTSSSYKHEVMLQSFLYIYPHLFPLLSIQSKINGFANAFLQYKITKSNRKVKENQRLGYIEVEASARDTNTNLSYHHIILGRWHQCTWLLAKMLLPGVYTAMDTLPGPSMIHLMASI